MTTEPISNIKTAIQILSALTIVAPTLRPAEARTRAVTTHEKAAAMAANSPMSSI